MRKKALFPGSFDPFTVAHLDILQRASKIFDEVVIAVGINSVKTGLIPHKERLDMLNIITEDFGNVEATMYEGLTIEYCIEIGAKFMIRGIRSVSDFEYEKAIVHMNNLMYPEIESVFIVSKPSYSSISSTIVREVMNNNGDISHFVPEKLFQSLKKYYKR